MMVMMMFCSYVPVLNIPMGSISGGERRGNVEKCKGNQVVLLI